MSNYKISGIVAGYGILIGITSGVAFFLSSIYAPSEQDKREALKKYSNPQSVARKKDFDEFFSKMKMANDAKQQKVFDGK